MRVLVLSPYPETIAPAIERAGDTVIASNEITDHVSADLIVSYGLKTDHSRTAADAIQRSHHQYSYCFAAVESRRRS